MLATFRFLYPQKFFQLGNLSFQFPVWFAIFCIAAGVVYSMTLYYRDRTFKEQSPRLNMILGLLRFLTVTLLSLLLLSPLLKSIITDIKKPVIVLAQDQSESIASGFKGVDSAQYRQAFRSLAESLGTEYEVHQYAFGEKVREGADFSYKDKVSNISALLKNTYDLYSNQNLGAVVLATDGIYNEGNNPLYTSSKLNVPVFTVALGDTTPKRDVFIKRAFHNNIAYLGDKFTVEVDVAARNCPGTTTTMTISKIDGDAVRPLQSFPIAINSNNFFKTQSALLDAAQSGVQRYRISLTTIQGEVSTVNNVKDIFIEVLDARTKVLLLANSPHPDIAAFNEAISANKNYQVTVAYINDLKVNVANFDIAILHQLPSFTQGAESVLKTLNDNRIPRLFVVGSQTDTRKLNTAQSTMIVLGDGRNSSDVQPIIAPNFSLFTMDERLPKELPNFVPLTTPFGDFKEGGGTHTLLYQRIGKVDTKYPLLTFGEQNGIKSAVLAGEGIWKWRLFDFLQRQNHELSNELISKTIQYLSVKEDKRKFRVSTSKNVYKENEPATFDAELYNDSYQLINDPEANLSIKSAEGKEYNFTFNKYGKAYHLEAGILPVGNYTYKGSVNHNGQQLSATGQFSVQPIQLELYENTADHAMLRQLSEKFGGSMVYPKDIARIAELIKSQAKIKPVMYSTHKTRSVINLKWIFFLLAGLLCVEWFARRYYGGY